MNPEEVITVIRKIKEMKLGKYLDGVRVFKPLGYIMRLLSFRESENY